MSIKNKATYRVSRISLNVPKPPQNTMSYSAAEKWVGEQSPGNQMFYSIKEITILPKVTFVLIKDNQVETAETIEADLESIKRKISHIQEQGFDSAVAVFSEGLKWDISFPMTPTEIEKEAINLHRNL
jgi:hypothetical protein